MKRFDKRHPFWPVVLPSSSVSKTVSIWFSQLPLHPCLFPHKQLLFNSPSKYPKNSFNHRRSPGENSSSTSASGEDNWIPQFLPVVNRLSPHHTIVSEYWSMAVPVFSRDLCFSQFSTQRFLRHMAFEFGVIRLFHKKLIFFKLIEWALL